MKYCETCGYVEVAPTGACRKCGQLTGPPRSTRPYRDPFAVLAYLIFGAIVLVVVAYWGVLAWVGSQLG